MTVMFKIEDLKKEIPYKLRMGPGGKQLAYIDSRDVQDMLDSVVGPQNWQSEFKLIDNKLFAGIGIRFGDDWVWKWDCGTESNIEKEKGEASDAFKRAAVHWGIGRFLYNLEDEKPVKKEVKQDAPKCEKCGTPKLWSANKSKWYCKPCVQNYINSKELNVN